MTIVADSGSTKTTWMEVETGNKIVTEGLNPHFSTDNQVLTACAAVREHFQHSALDATLHFYGAGCGSDSQRERMRNLLAKSMGADVHVETDMLGACRAVAGDKPSLVGIMGTGSNACYYDGEKIQYSAVSTGYILGDEGSANYAGRRFLQEYLTGMIAKELAEKFRREYNLSNEEILHAVYHMPNANRFLASIAPFVVRYSRYSNMDYILRQGFDGWIFHQLMPFWNKTNCNVLNLVGGFAKAMERKLRRYATETPFAIGKVIADPIDGLMKYHKIHNP